MKLKSLDIGRLTIKNNVLVAPLAGFSDFAFRRVCYALGAGLCFTEMISAKGLCYGGAATEQLLHTTADEYVKAVQLFGSDHEFFLRAIQKPQFDDFDVIDINFGCPVPKGFNNGEGSAMLLQPQKAEKIVRALTDAGKTVTVKMRLGAVDGDCVAVDFGKRMQDAGAKLITLHARYRSQYYSGEPDYAACERLKKAVDIPVIFNGGIFTAADATAAIDKTGADGVMLARGVLYAPWLICDIVGTPQPDKRALIKGQIDDLCDFFGEQIATRYFRKQMALYLKNVRGGKRLKESVFTATTRQEYYDIIENADFC